MKKFISVLLSIFMVCSFSSVVFAENSENLFTSSTIEPRYAGIRSTAGSASISGGDVQLYGSVTLWPGYTGQIRAELQEAGGDGVWRTVSNYSSTRNTTFAALNASYPAKRGCRYRALYYVTSYTSGGALADNTTFYSNIVSA